MATATKKPTRLFVRRVVYSNGDRPVAGVFGSKKAAKSRSHFLDDVVEQHAFRPLDTENRFRVAIVTWQYKEPWPTEPLEIPSREFEVEMTADELTTREEGIQEVLASNEKSLRTITKATAKGKKPKFDDDQLSWRVLLELGQPIGDPDATLVVDASGVGYEIREQRYPVRAVRTAEE